MSDSPSPTTLDELLDLMWLWGLIWNVNGSRLAKESKVVLTGTKNKYANETSLSLAFPTVSRMEYDNGNNLNNSFAFPREHRERCILTETTK